MRVIDADTETGARQDSLLDATHLRGRCYICTHLLSRDPGKELSYWVTSFSQGYDTFPVRWMRVMGELGPFCQRLDIAS